MSDACPDCGHAAESHGDWNWPVKCLYGPCDCRTPGANLRALLAVNGDGHTHAHTGGDEGTA